MYSTHSLKLECVEAGKYQYLFHGEVIPLDGTDGWWRAHMKSKWFKTLLAIFFLIFIVSVIVNPKAPSRPYYDGVTVPLVIAHQGGDGIFPGDTMYAFEHAVALGADVLEMDAHITKDGEIVLMHDEKVDRTTDGTGLIEDLTLADLK